MGRTRVPDARVSRNGRTSARRTCDGGRCRPETRALRVCTSAVHPGRRGRGRHGTLQRGVQHDAQALQFGDAFVVSLAYLRMHLTDLMTQPSLREHTGRRNSSVSGTRCISWATRTRRLIARTSVVA